MDKRDNNVECPTWSDDEAWGYAILCEMHKSIRDKWILKLRKSRFICNKKTTNNDHYAIKFNFLMKTESTIFLMFVKNQR